jgi:hypothetical protein
LRAAGLMRLVFSLYLLLIVVVLVLYLFVGLLGI